MPRHGLLLINLGTPDAPRTREVRSYLREFLSDPRVLDMHPLSRFLVLNLFILPFRPRRSAAAYRLIWTDRGSPLLLHGQDLVERLEKRLGADVQIELAMRYKKPSISSALKRFRKAGIDQIVCLPLFPQYSSAAFGSAVQKLFEEAGKLWNVPSLQVVPPFYDHEGFLDACANEARTTLSELDADHILMSFHGLPERHISKSEEPGERHCLQLKGCCDAIVLANRNCYRAHCFATARGIAERLDLDSEKYTVSFQSRLGRDPWIRPFTDEVVTELAKKGVRRLAVLSPAFVADCLETLEELAIRAAEDFRAHGGERLELVPSLNSSPAWVDAVVDLVRTGTTLGLSEAR